MIRFSFEGLDYYSRTTYEFESPLLGAQSSIAGGGRYDLLSKEVGSKEAIPAVGFGCWNGANHNGHDGRGDFGGVSRSGQMFSWLP